MNAHVWRLNFFFLVVIASGCSNEVSPEDSSTALNSTSDKNDRQADVDMVATALRGQPILSDAVKSVRFHPNGKKLAVGSGTGAVQFWNLLDRSPDLRIKAHENWTFDLAFSPDGKQLASAGGDNRVRLWSVTTGESLPNSAEQDEDVHGVAFDPNQRYLVSGSDDTKVMIWDLQSGEKKFLTGHKRQVTSVAMNPNGTQFASADREGKIRIWSLPSGELLATLLGHSADVLSICYSPDGKFLASGSYDKTVRLWEVATWQQVHVMKKHDDWVFAVTFAPDGQTIVSGAGDKAVYFWRTETGNDISSMRFDADVSALDYSPDGSTIAVGLANGKVSLLKVNGEKLERLGVLYLEPKHENPKPNSKQDNVTAAEYLRLHNAAMLPTSSAWSNSVARLAQTGDRFTIIILKELNPDNLGAADSELLHRTLQQIRTRVERGNQRLDPGELQLMLERAALADLNCDKLESILVPWTLETIRKDSNSDSIKTELERIRDLYVPSAQKPTAFGSMQKRVRDYAQQILTPTNPAREKDS